MTESSYNEQVSTLWGQEPNPSDFGMSAWQWANTYGDRPIMDTLSALVYDNLFGRFPNLCGRLGGERLRVDALPRPPDGQDARAWGGTVPGSAVRSPSAPATIFRRHVLVTPFPEDDVRAVVDALGRRLAGAGVRLAPRRGPGRAG